MKRCAKCKSLMPDDVTLCIRCGFDSKAAPNPYAAPAAPVVPAAQVKKGKLRNGFALAVQSWRVLMLDKALLLFPLLSGIACFLILASFLGAALAADRASGNAPPNDVALWAGVFLCYFANYFVIVFFNSALVACAMMRFRGGSPTVRDGLRAARERLPKIVAWALLSATVGVILRTIEERVGFLGRIVASLLGTAWTIGTYFAVPVLVVENVGPFEALKRSAAIVKKAWGESIVGNASVGLLAFLAVVFLVVPCAIVTAILALEAGSLAIGIAGAALTLALLVLIALVGSALGSILLSAVYLYATGGKAPQGFEAARLQGAFVAR